MGVVYEAVDTRLGRHVALKVLPEDLANNALAFERLKREARAACRLNHPNICTIHEIEEENGQPVIVMELLEGQVLKDRLGQGAIHVPEMLEMGAQIADALCAAHELGIVHRDIKPANIFLTRHGSIKVLDFGLAKLLTRPQLGSLEESTVQDGVDHSLTAVGIIPGTASYMSPEQAKGEQLDARTDLFSLGVVLYHMATGEQPFRRTNNVLTLDAILNSKPKPPSQVNENVPPKLDEIIAKSLAKDREQRYQTAAELRDALWQLRSELYPDSVTYSHRGFASRHPSAGMDGVEADQTSSTKRTTTGMWRNISTWKLFVPTTLVILAIGAGVFLYSHRSPALTEKDTMLLADFDNKTGDPVFDETLKQALAVDLGQSPFLNLVSDRKTIATLRMMGRSPDQPVTGEVARDLCQRVGSKAMLAGAISNLGENYVISLNAIDCITGDALVKRQVQAHGKEEVLKTLGNAARDMRENLGESLSSLQRFAMPIEEATTPSLEALKAYSMGRRAQFAKGDTAAIPFYERALELDPKFALAYRALAVSYVNLGQATRAIENAKKAFDLRDRVSEREKYAISARYYQDVIGDLNKSYQIYELWKQSYPRDFLPLLNLGDLYMRTGEWEKALRETEASLRLEPNSGVTNSNLAAAQLALNRTDDAKTTVEQATARSIDFYFLRIARYEAAFLKDDEQGMQQQVAWAAGRSGEEDWLISTQADTEAYFGRLRKARELSQRAVELALRADARETAAVWQANSALREAEFGNASSGQQGALAALALLPGRDVRCLAALALARAGDVSRARKLADSLNRDFPQNTLVQSYWLPVIRSAIEINQSNLDSALQALQDARPYELAQSQPLQVGTLYPTYLRGQAFLKAHRGQEAITEFQKIIEHRGIVLNFPLGALAYVGLARGYTLEGDIPKAQTAYDEFLKLWRTADTNIPILRQSRAEAAMLH